MPSRYLLFLVVVLLALPTAQAQDNTFAVTVIASTANNPRPDPWPVVYAIDGVESPELTLVRGETYAFEIGAGAEIHPFYISTSDVGGGAGVWSDGVTGNFSTTGSTLTFAVPVNAPDLLYYECGAHVRMGWRLNITNPVSTEEPAQPLALALDAAYPNPFAEATRLNVTLPEGRGVSVVVYDEAGRRVRVLHDGPLPAGTTPLDFRAADLANGVYTVRATAGETVREQRVVLVR